MNINIDIDIDAEKLKQKNIRRNCEFYATMWYNDCFETGKYNDVKSENYELDHCSISCDLLNSCLLHEKEKRDILLKAKEQDASTLPPVWEKHALNWRDKCYPNKGKEQDRKECHKLCLITNLSFIDTFLNSKEKNMVNE